MRAARIHPRPVRTGERPSFAGARLLLVEDDPELRGALADLLRFEGLDVAEAENGLEALLHLHGHATDVVVLDLVMPLMTGWEFRELQLRDPVIAAIPVVVLSSRRPDGLRADAVLEKPCRPEALLDAVERVLGAA